MNKETKKEGMPAIAIDAGRKKPLFLLIAALFLVIVLAIYYFSGVNKKRVSPQEETYSVQTETQEEDKSLSVSGKNNKNAPGITKEMLEQRRAEIQEKQKELEQRLAAPLMLVNASQARGATGAERKSEHVLSADANTQFMDTVFAQNTEVSEAKSIGPLNEIIAEGNFIHAILEPATNSDLPGPLRAIVNEPVYAEDGSAVLIPRGSRLIGQYKSGMLQGQSRIFIVWTRLITPQGISIQLGSEGIDSLGVAGMGANEINRHFWERFSTAALLSLIGAGAANAGVESGAQENSVSMYRMAVASSFAQSASQSLQQQGQIAPTLKTWQGKPIMVFVAHDLHFHQAIKSIKPKTNIF